MKFVLTAVMHIFLRYAFIAKNEISNIRLLTDYEGNMRWISAGPPYKYNGEEVVPLPKSMLDTLPTPVMKYIEYAFPDYPVSILREVSQLYRIDTDREGISDRLVLTINKSNEFLEVYFYLEGGFESLASRKKFVANCPYW